MLLEKDKEGCNSKYSKLETWTGKDTLVPSKGPLFPPQSSVWGWNPLSSGGTDNYITTECGAPEEVNLAMFNRFRQGCRPLEIPGVLHRGHLGRSFLGAKITANIQQKERVSCLRLSSESRVRPRE